MAGFSLTLWIQDYFNMSKSLSEKLGIYYILFHKWQNGYVKCWFNGSEQATLKSYQEFVQLSQADGINYKLELRIKDALRESSLFFWDIEADIVKPLSPAQAESDLGLQLTNTKEQVLKEKKKSWIEKAFGVRTIPLYKSDQEDL